MYKLVLIRHGESTWNLENRFTGWTDVDLTPTGIEQAKNAGKLLKAEGYEFDVAYTSVLKRAIRTLYLALDEMDCTWLPVVKSWRLNERHYGGLQGLNKADMAKQYGDEQVLVWRRSYDTPPPALEAHDPRCERSDRRYPNPQAVPLTECLKDTVARVLPCWNDTLAPAIRAGRRVLVTGHTGFKGGWLALWLQRLGAQVSGYALAPEPGGFIRVASPPWQSVQPRITAGLAGLGPMMSRSTKVLGSIPAPMPR